MDNYIKTTGMHAELQRANCGSNTSNKIAPGRVLTEYFIFLRLQKDRLFETEAERDLAKFYYNKFLELVNQDAKL